MTSVPILMIEDQSHFAEMVIHLLEGLDIEVVQTLAAAKERLATKRYGLVLVDLGLPDSQGLDTLRALKGFKVPKVVLTARCDLGSEVASLDCVDFIYKGDVGSRVDIYERILFNIAKVRRPKLRFKPEVFEVLKGCLAARVPELTPAH